jgi:hypothetical protein
MVLSGIVITAIEGRSHRVIRRLIAVRYIASSHAGTSYVSLIRVRGGRRRRACFRAGFRGCGHLGRSRRTRKAPG